MGSFWAYIRSTIAPLILSHGETINGSPWCDNVKTILVSSQHFHIVCSRIIDIYCDNISISTERSVCVKYRLSLSWDIFSWHEWNFKLLEYKREWKERVIVIVRSGFHRSSRAVEVTCLESSLLLSFSLGRL